mgnify:FL=1
MFLLIFIAIFVFLAGACSTDPGYTSIRGYAQGGTYTVTLSLDNHLKQKDLSLLIEQCFHDIDFSVSGYNKASSLSRFNAGESIGKDSLLTELFEISRRLWESTEGAFDPSAGPLFDFWGFGFEEGGIRQPDDPRTIAAVDSLKDFTGMSHFSIGEEGGLVRDDPRCRLNFNAIALGYTCYVIGRRLTEKGVRNFLIEVGGEILCKGVNPGGDKWRIGIDTPKDGSMKAGESISAIISVNDCGVVTSGNYRKFYKDSTGRKIAHTIDPSTGFPAENNLLSATVIAPTSAEADALATWAMVAGYEKARNRIEADTLLRAYLITTDGVWSNIEGL